MAITPSYFLTFGMVTIPVKSYTASRERTTSFTQLHGACADKGVGAKLSLERKCQACGKDAGPDVVKGYESAGGQYVLMRAEELKALEVEKTKTMEVKSFVPVEDVDTIFLGRANFLGPADQAATKGFTLLREAMHTTARAAIVQYVQSGHDKIGFLRTSDEGALVMHELFYPDEVRTYAAQNRVETKAIASSKEEAALAVELVSALEAPFDLAGFKDGYQERLNELIAARLAGKPVPKFETAPAAQPSVDIMAALKQSIAARLRKPAAKADVKVVARKRRSA